MDNGTDVFVVIFRSYVENVEGSQVALDDANIFGIFVFDQLFSAYIKNDVLLTISMHTYVFILMDVVFVILFPSIEKKIVWSFCGYLIS